MGTNGDGVARYDGDTLEYFSQYAGFGGAAVRGIVEDKEGNVWFGTSGGLTKYDGVSFTNYTTKNGLVDNDICCFATFLEIFIVRTLLKVVVRKN